MSYRIGIDFTDIISINEVMSKCMRTGVGLFCRDIVQGFVSNGHKDELVIYTYSFGKRYLENLFPGVEVQVVKSYGGTILAADKIIQNKLTRKILNNCLQKTIKKSKVDLVWLPYTRLDKLDSKIPYISTVHDLIAYHTQSDKYRLPFVKSLNDARKAVTISSYVKDDIIGTLNIAESKIQVIPNSIHYKKSIEKQIKEISFPYILDVNGFREYKNTIKLIKAFNTIKNLTICNLVLCSGSRDNEYYKKIVECINENNLGKRVVILYQINEESLEWLYNHAELFVNPSTQEGFGRTPVEAALHKIPVLTTKETSLYEVTMGLLEYIEDPYNENEIAGKILKILEKGVDYDISEVSEKYISQYDPRNIADMYWRVFSNQLETENDRI